MLCTSKNKSLNLICIKSTPLLVHNSYGVEDIHLEVTRFRSCTAVNNISVQ